MINDDIGADVFDVGGGRSGAGLPAGCANKPPTQPNPRAQ